MKRTKSQKATHKNIIFLVAIFIAIFIVLNWLSPMLLWDENTYLANARSHIKNANYTEDFRFPLIEYVIAGVWFFTGESVFAGRLVTILFSAGSLFFMYKILQNYFDEKKSIIFTLLFGINIQFLFFGFRVYAEIPTMFFIISSFFFLKKESYIASGILSGLAFLSRFPSFIFPFSMIIFLVYFKKIKNVLYFILGFMIPLMPWMIYNRLNYSNPFWDFLEYYKVVKTNTYWEPISKQIFNMIAALGPLILLLPEGIYRICKKKGIELSLVVYSAIFLFYYLFIVKLKDPRYNLLLFPFVYIIAFQNPRNKNKLIFFIVVVYLLIAAAFMVGSMAYKNRCDSDGALMKSIEFVKQNTNQTGHILSNFWVYFGYYDNLNAHSLWSEDIKSLVSQYDANYVIYYTYRGYNKTNDYIRDYNETILKNNLILIKTFNDSCGNKVDIYSR